VPAGAAARVVLFDEAAGVDEHEVEHALEGVGVGLGGGWVGW